LFHQFVAGNDWTNNDRFYVMDGTLCVDYMIRYERLSDDLAEICRRVGLPAITLPHLKSGMREGGHPYAEYYDEASKVIVAERHHHDIRLFGYRF
jgi:hypothetical protein